MDEVTEERTCPKCGGSMPEIERICPHCGYDLRPALHHATQWISAAVGATLGAGGGALVGFRLALYLRHGSALFLLSLLVGGIGGAIVGYFAKDQWRASEREYPEPRTHWGWW